jgi:serine/threonine-protein kinase
VLYQLLTNELPFCGESVHEVLMAIIEEDPVPLRERRPDLPEELGEVVERCLQKDRSQRFPDVAHLAEALAPFAPAESRVSVTGIANTLGISLRRAAALSSSRSTETSAMATTVQAPGPPHAVRAGDRPRVRIARVGLVVVVAMAAVVTAIIWPRTRSAAPPLPTLPQTPMRLGPAVEPVSVAAAPIATVAPAATSAASATSAPSRLRAPFRHPVESRPPPALPLPRADGGVLDETVETRL